MLLDLCCFSSFLWRAFYDFLSPRVPLLFSSGGGQGVLSSPPVSAGVTNGNEAQLVARSTNSKHRTSAERKWKGVISNRNEEHKWRGLGGQLKGQTPEVKTCAGQSLSEACITGFDHWQDRNYCLFQSFPKLRLLFRHESNVSESWIDIDIFHQFKINILYFVFPSVRGAVRDRQGAFVSMQRAFTSVSMQPRCCVHTLCYAYLGAVWGGLKMH